MPVQFSFERVKQYAQYYSVGQPHVGESEKEYRLKVARAAFPKDKIEAIEILTGLPWDEWGDDEKGMVLRGIPIHGFLTKREKR